MIIKLAALASAAAASPVGLWTSIPANATGALPRHDALRVSTGLGHALVVRCEHGGWSNLSVLACAFDAATLATDNATEVTLETPTTTVRGRYAAESADCAWTDEEAGEYWDGAGEYKRPFYPRCERIDWGDGEAWIKLRSVKKVHVVSMSHLDVGYTGSIAFTLNSYFADFFPKAIEVQAALQGDPNATLHYLTHPWLVYNFLRCDELEEEMGAALDAPLKCPNATTLEAFNASVRRGTIAWRAPAREANVRPKKTNETVGTRAP